MFSRRVQMGMVVVLAVAMAAAAAGCGVWDIPGVWDETCYDCRTVCEGTQDDVLDDCLASCSECQGHSACFAALDGQFEGQILSIVEWDAVDCAEVY
jgi:hypothetical protein